MCVVNVWVYTYVIFAPSDAWLQQIILNASTAKSAIAIINPLHTLVIVHVILM